ncbi:hypothetical protein Bache_2697 [Bacteroides helcogenes P 36-108]|uniref:Uncharacterized protein n=1 Tax=Bacteroides helcogenes (strain ATCC 35417 / DSM 20613 / JCM 6297 / CCUG 15421 / P 36-108) TaxID=693979 RepID=E6SWI1_BACT6|nr:hypothetical protein Bache_2697 [Bacteroides helcogenes P 36-108]
MEDYERNLIVFHLHNVMECPRHFTLTELYLKVPSQLGTSSTL